MLRLLGSLYRSGPQLASALVTAGWNAATDAQARRRATLGQWIQDLTWLRRAVTQRQDLPLPADDLKSWESLVRRSQPAWKRIMRIGVHAYA
eukprot:3727949-Pyramimonas_sp.AAC.1